VINNLNPAINIYKYYKKSKNFIVKFILIQIHLIFYNLGVGSAFLELRMAHLDGFGYLNYIRLPWQRKKEG
jgi:hypothetical protein